MNEQSPKDAGLQQDLRWLVCPACLHPLQPESGTIRCEGCNRRYPVVDGIPVLLKDRAI